jgi:hypothetical protein
LLICVLVCFLLVANCMNSKLIPRFLIVLTLASCGPATVKTDTTTNETPAPSAEQISIPPDSLKLERNQTISGNQLIAPGKSIGLTSLGVDAETLEKNLGRPDRSDAAMGKAWLSWIGKKRDDHNNQTRLDIYTTYADTTMRSKAVKQIRVTSSFFKTKEGLGVYSGLVVIKQHHPGLKAIGSYREDGRSFAIYDAISEGIAFEIVKAGNEEICTGVIVHQPGVRVTDVYIFLHPDMKLIP